MLAPTESVSEQLGWRGKLGGSPVQLKFTMEPTGSPDIDIFDRKVSSKADNTMGIFVSISGY
ncbi:MAG: hypothetical protein HQL07_02780 [Nitrospirae bacterium]|nr:hypothetical protein [Magnetococcales bacterium]